MGFMRPGNPAYLLEDIIALEPTSLPAAPRVLNKIHDAIKAKISGQHTLVGKAFNKALEIKVGNLREKQQLTHAVFDPLLFNKIKIGLGLRNVKNLTSGGAPLSPEVHDFFRAILSVPILQGYGMTENGASTTITSLTGDHATNGVSFKV